MDQVVKIWVKLAVSLFIVRLFPHGRLGAPPISSLKSGDFSLLHRLMIALLVNNASHHGNLVCSLREGRFILRILSVLPPCVLTFGASEELGWRFIGSSRLNHPPVCFTVLASGAFHLGGRHCLNFGFFFAYDGYAFLENLLNWSGDHRFLRNDFSAETAFGADEGNAALLFGALATEY